MKRLATTRMLGFYLMLAASLEVAACYSNKVSVFLLPRTGWAMLLGRLKPEGNFAIEFPEVVSACWLLTLGVLLARGRRPLKTYIVSEALLSFPTLLFSAALLLTGGGHVAFRTDAFKILGLAMAFTAMPMLIAIRALKESTAVKAV